MEVRVSRVQVDGQERSVSDQRQENPAGTKAGSEVERRQVDTVWQAWLWKRAWCRATMVGLQEPYVQ